MPRTAFVTHSDCSRHDTGWRHPEHQGRLPALARAVYRDMLTLFDALEEVEARHATADDLHLVHTPAYVERVRLAVRSAAERERVVDLAGELRVSGGSWEAALAAAGAVLTAADRVVDGEVVNAFCAVRPPGHDAFRDRPGGHSIFNNVAIAAAHLLERRGLDRVLIVDGGAGGGRGTAEIAASAAGVDLVTVAVGADADAEWPDGTVTARVMQGADYESYAASLLDAVDRTIDRATPALLLFSAGFDVLETDPSGTLRLRPLDFHPLTEALRARAEAACRGRLVSVLEGGYAPAATGAAVVQHLRALASLPPA